MKNKEKWNYWFSEIELNATLLLFSTPLPLLSLYLASCYFVWISHNFFLCCHRHFNNYIAEDKVSSCLVYFLFYDFHSLCVEMRRGCNNNEFIWYAHKFVRGELRKFKTWKGEGAKIVESMLLFADAKEMVEVVQNFLPKMKLNKLNFFFCCCRFCWVRKWEWEILCEWKIRSKVWRLSLWVMKSEFFVLLTSTLTLTLKKKIVSKLEGNLWRTRGQIHVCAIKTFGKLNFLFESVSYSLRSLRSVFYSADAKII